jgi:hypothetical protein
VTKVHTHIKNRQNYISYILIFAHSYVILISSSSIGTTTLVGFWPAQLSLSILSRKVLQNAVASGTSNPQLGGEPGI